VLFSQFLSFVWCQIFDENVHKQNFLNIILRLNTFYVKVYKVIAYKKKLLNVI